MKLLFQKWPFLGMAIALFSIHAFADAGDDVQSVGRPESSLSAEQSEGRSLEAILESHEANWQSVYSLKMQYNVTTRSTSGGQVVLDRTSRGNFWAFNGDSKRLTVKDLDGRGGVVDRMISDGELYELRYPLSISEKLGSLQLCDGLSVRATVSEADPGLLDDIQPQSIRLIRFLGISPRLSLRDLVETWDSVTVKPSEEGDDILIAAQYPASLGGRYAGSRVQVSVSPSHGHLITSVDLLENNVARADGAEGHVPYRTDSLNSDAELAAPVIADRATRQPRTP